VADLDGAGGLQRREETVQWHLLDVGRQVARGDARHVLGDHLGEGIARHLAQRVEDRAVEQRRTVRGDQRIEPERSAFLVLLAIGADEQAERRRRSESLVVLDGEIERLAQLVEILCVGIFGTLLEPLGGQRLGRHALAGAAVAERDADADHRLDAAGHGDHAEAEGEPVLHRPLVAFDLLEFDLHCCSNRPATYPIMRAAQVAPSGS
jgi:hypothetical protein